MDILDLFSLAKFAGKLSTHILWTIMMNPIVRTGILVLDGEELEIVLRELKR